MITFRVALIHGNKTYAQVDLDGLRGVIRKNPKRPISLISLTARQEVDQATLRGLCFKKFNADLTLDCQKLPGKGAQIATDQVQLVILPESKQCFAECILIQKKLPCPLRDGVRYASVASPGMICLGDLFTLIDG